MKPIRFLVQSFFLILGLSFSVQADPPTGTWNTPDHFKAGIWEELLWGGKEGQAGNEIKATSGPYYKFQGALLSEVEEIIPPKCKGAAEFETKYLGGILELVTGVLPAPPVSPAPSDPDAPWYISNGAAPYIIDLGETIVKTCKYANGQMSFSLKSGGIFQNPVYPKYIAEISAEYLGTPTLNKGNPSSLSGNLDFAQITITGIVAVDIKPGSCPNPINVKSRGVIPMAILGGKDLEIRAIDFASIYLTNGLTDNDGNLITVAPIRLGIEDVGGPYPFDPLMPREDRMDCGVSTADSIMDLTLKFSTPKVVEAFNLKNEEDSSTQEWFLMFSLKDPNRKIVKEMVGSDLVWILNKTISGNIGPKANRLKRNIR